MADDDADGPTLALSEVHGSLSLFAEAIVGRPVSVEVADEFWPAIPVDPDRATVLVPASVEGEGEPARRLFRAVVLHQCAGIELAAGTDAVDYGALGRSHPLLPDAFGWLEDARIAAVARRRYPGGAADLIEAAAHPVRPQRSLPAPIAALRWRCLDVTVSDTRYTGSPLLAAVDRAVDRVRVEGATRSTSLSAAIELLRTTAQAMPLADLDVGGVDAEVPEAAEASGSALDSAASPDRVEDREGASGGRPIDDDLDAASVDGAEPPDDDPLGGLVLPVQGRKTESDARTYVYDEWDFRAESHRRAWCRVLEERVVGDDPSFIVDVRDRHRDLRADIRHRFGRLRPERLMRIPRSLDGEELDLDAVIEAIADRRSGAPADDRFQVRRDRAARDVATIFLVDLSASTSSPIVEPEPDPRLALDPEDDPLSYAPIWDPNVADPEPPRRVIDVAKDAVALMSDALDELGDRHAVYGFSGSGRHNVQLRVVKELADPVSPVTWAALDAVRPLRYTRMGPAIRHATAKLGGDAARTRLLIVISDGYPQDVDYGEDARDREYGIRDTARALADAEASGIDTFCLTIDPAGQDYLRDMAPEQRYLVIDDVEALPEELAKLYLAMAG